MNAGAAHLAEFVFVARFGWGTGLVDCFYYRPAALGLPDYIDFMQETKDELYIYIKMRRRKSLYRVDK